MKKVLSVILFLILATSVYAQSTLQIDAFVTETDIKSDTCVYNLSNAKMHTHDCEWAEKCTKNCIFLPKDELEKVFFIPCAVCGGNILKTPDSE